MSLNFTKDPADLRLTVVQTEILVEAAQHHRQLLLLILPLPILPEPLLGFGQELSAAFRAWNSSQGKLVSLIRAALMLKAQEVERLRLFAGLRLVSSDKRPKRITRVFSSPDSKPNFSEAILQVLLERFRFAPVLEIHNEVIGESRQVRISLTRWPDLLSEPEIKNKMKLDVRQDRTDYSPYTKGNCDRQPRKQLYCRLAVGPAAGLKCYGES